MSVIVDSEFRDFAGFSVENIKATRSVALSVLGDHFADEFVGVDA